MAWLQRGKVRIELDDQGHLADPAQWNEKVAAVLAEEEGVAPLSDDHWTVIDFLREYHEEHDTAPMIRVLVKETGLSLKRIYELFPSGPGKGACRVAGLPRPDSCV